MTADREWFYDFFEQDYFRKTPEQIGRIIDMSVPEVDFLTDALQVSPDHRILDLCCGYGRHAITFAKRGYNIVGFDLCKRALGLARQKAQEEHLGLHLVRGDIRTLPFRDGFDAVYHVFSFGYFEDDSEIMAVLDGVSRGLKPEGKFLIDLINLPRILRNFIEDTHEEGEEGDVLQKRAYDAENKRLRTKWTFVYKDSGETNEHTVVQRLCSVNELISMLDSVSLETLKIYGDTNGSEYNGDSKRMIIVSRKK